MLPPAGIALAGFLRLSPVGIEVFPDFQSKPSDQFRRKGIADQRRQCLFADGCVKTVVVGKRLQQRRFPHRDTTVFDGMKEAAL